MHAVRLANVLAEQPAACRLPHLLRQLLEFFEIIARMVRVGEIGGPEKTLRAVEVGERRDRPLVGIARDPTLAAEIRARLLLERHVLAEERRLVNGIEAVEPV